MMRMMWTECTHALAAQMQETTIRVPCDTFHKKRKCARLARTLLQHRSKPILQAVRWTTLPRILKTCATLLSLTA